MNRNNIGKTFAFTQCPAWTDGDNQKTTISGLYTVEDVVYPDRTCGQWEGGYLVFEADLADMGTAPMFFVDSDSFYEQVDPQAYGRRIVMEREMEFASEDFDKQYGELFTEQKTTTTLNDNEVNY